MAVPLLVIPTLYTTLMVRESLVMLPVSLAVVKIN